MKNLRYFKSDVSRYFPDGFNCRQLIYNIFDISIWCILNYRIGKDILSVKNRILRLPLTCLYFLSYKILELIAGIRISSESEIGPGLMIHNYGGIIIKGSIGKNCTVVQGAQIISRADGKGSGWPTLGDNVYVGSGAKILGNIKIGDNVTIGANSVILKNISDNMLVMPPESKVLNKSLFL